MKDEKRALALKRIEQRLKVLGKGRGYIAHLILELAKERNIPIKEDKLLVDRLFEEVDLYEDIPPELFEYVVRVLDFLYETKEK